MPPPQERFQPGDWYSNASIGLPFSFVLSAGDVVGDWCPFPPILGPLILGNLAPPEKVATFPVRAKGQTIEVFIDRNLKERFESKYWSGLLDAQGKATGDYY